ncbi:MAG: winged helix-turn-helix transcriptional regulator [Promethearchaeota archaeon]|nr:MAG: winged helix-turn-helix transcriptional regulator [Candidatus Lokiarchaeota archaeon]
MPVELKKWEHLILSIVQEYLNQNKFFNMKKVIYFIDSKLKMMSVDLNYRAIEEILRSLVKKKIIREGTKLSRNEILNNETRKKIYEFIIKNPGAYFNRIAREVELNKAVIIWHINILEKFAFIKREEFENHEIFFEIDINENNNRFRFITSKEKSKKIINFLKQYDYGITKTHLSAELGMHHNTISKYLRILEEFNVVIKKKTYKKTLYFLNEAILESINLNV